MIIKKLDASFGKLSHNCLTLQDGMNVIYAPNESGKSTWCAFIRSMLYGIDTSQRDKIGFLSDKTRYRPWNGGAMEGTMVVHAGGRDLSIQRTAQGSSPMRRVKINCVDTGEAVTDITGEMLTGASEEVFYRTAFIGQAGVKVGQSSDLERRISSIVSSGSEDTSYSQIDGRLRAWQRKLRFNRSGELPGLEQKLADAEKRLSTLNMANDRLTDIKNELIRLENKEAQLKNDLETHKKLAARAEKRRVLDARKAAEDSRLVAEQLRSELTVDDHLITKEEISQLRSELASLEAVKLVTSDSYSALEKAREENNGAKLLLAQCPFGGKNPEHVSEQAKAAEEYDKTLKEYSSKKGPKLAKTLLPVGAILALIMGLAAIFALHKTGIAIGCFALAVAMAAAFFLIPKTDKNARAARDGILQEFHVLTVGELSQAAKDYVNLSAQENSTAINVSAAEKAYTAAAEKSEQAESELLAAAAKLFPGVKQADRLPSLMSRAENTLSMLTKAEYDSEAKSNIYKLLLESYDGNPDEEDEEFLVQPLRDPAGTKDQLKKTIHAETELRERYNLELGSLKAMGDPAILNGEIQEITGRIIELKSRYDALSLAIQTLKEADNELQTRFSPVISRIAGEYMSRLTAGRYEKLLFDKSFDAMAKIGGDSVGRSVLSLSCGTADQLYLSLRLAMCELMLAGDEPCPIILDDALVSFDDERLINALDLLWELSKNRQIILFSCHNREADYFADTGANVIRAM